jgi:hypothetical protein
MEVSFEVISDILEHIFSIEWTLLPYYIAIVAVCITIAYCVAMFLIGLSVSIWEHFAKKKVNSEKAAKVIKVVTALFSAMLIYVFLYEKVR